jgi:hypothetical protein
MKKALCVLLIGAFLFFSAIAFGGTKDLTFLWEQEISADFAGWKLYKSTTSGSGYELWQTINYVAEQGTYTSDYELTSPSGESVEYFFVMTAFDTSANESEYSNQASIVIDFAPPVLPLRLRVRVKSVP